MKVLRIDQVDTTATPVLDVSLRPERTRIRGALRCDPKQLLLADPLELPVPSDGALAVYGDSESVVAAVVDKLLRCGYAGAARLEGGLPAWRDAGLPLEDTP